MSEFLAAVRNETPLKISFVSWDETTLVISGDNWSFSTQSIWRLFKDEEILLGCLDNQSEKICSILKDELVLKIDFQNTQRQIDPVFYLENKVILENFSTDRDEPWVLNLPSLGVYVGTGRSIL